MPYPGEHAARINDPGKYDRMRRQNNKFGKGIHVIFGVKDNVSEVQAIRFDKDLFTVEEAKKWLDEHDYKGYSFEPASSEKEAEGLKPFRRQLSFDFTGLKPTDFIEKDGGLIAPGVKLLAEGEWTDSAQQTPLYYPPRTLEKFAGNWMDNSVWSRHSGGMPRSITDKIGKVLNHRFDDNAVKGDIFWHGLTQQSKDSIALVRAGEINYVSVEHGGEEKWNPESKRMEAESITFYGLATVNRGACKVCTIRASEEGLTETTNTVPPLTNVLMNSWESGTGNIEGIFIYPFIPQTGAGTASAGTGQRKEEESMEAKEFAEKAKELETLKATVEKLTKELSEANKSLEAFKEIDARVKKLEANPLPPVTEGKIAEKQLEDPAVRVTIEHGEVFVE